MSAVAYREDPVDGRTRTFMQTASLTTLRPHSPHCIPTFVPCMRCLTKHWPPDHD